MIINTNDLVTEKIKIIFQLLLAEEVTFDQEKYIKVWKKSFALFKNGLISAKELVLIGSKLQTRKLPKDLSIGAFTNKDFFDLLEYCSTLVFKLGMKEIDDISEEDIAKLRDYTNNL